MLQGLTAKKVEDQEQEIWKPARGYEGCYSVSISGKIKRTKAATGATVGNKLKPYKNKDGYLKVILSENNKLKTWRVHRLVAITFLGNPPEGLEVNHIDGIKSNNHVSNLEYVTAGQNIQHGYKLGLCKPQIGEKHHAAKLKEKDVLEIRRLFSANIYNKTELSRIYKISRRMIRYIINRENWIHI